MKPYPPEMGALISRNGGLVLQSRLVIVALRILGAMAPLALLLRLPGSCLPDWMDVSGKAVTDRALP